MQENIKFHTLLRYEALVNLFEEFGPLSKKEKQFYADILEDLKNKKGVSLKSGEDTTITGRMKSL